MVYFLRYLSCVLDPLDILGCWVEALTDTAVELAYRSPGEVTLQQGELGWRKVGAEGERGVDAGGSRENEGNKICVCGSCDS